MKRTSLVLYFSPPNPSIPCQIFAETILFKRTKNLLKRRKKLIARPSSRDEMSPGSGWKSQNDIELALKDMTQAEPEPWHKKARIQALWHLLNKVGLSWLLLGSRNLGSIHLYRRTLQPNVALVGYSKILPLSFWHFIKLRHFKKAFSISLLFKRTQYGHLYWQL